MSTTNAAKPYNGKGQRQAVRNLLARTLDPRQFYVGMTRTTWMARSSVYIRVSAHSIDVDGERAVIDVVEVSVLRRGDGDTTAGHRAEVAKVLTDNGWTVAHRRAWAGSHGRWTDDLLVFGPGVDEWVRADRKARAENDARDAAITAARQAAHTALVENVALLGVGRVYVEHGFPYARLNAADVEALLARLAAK